MAEIESVHHFTAGAEAGSKVARIRRNRDLNPNASIGRKARSLTIAEEANGKPDLGRKGTNEEDKVELL